MQARLQPLIRQYKINGKHFTLQQAFKKLNLEDSYCSKLIEPINAVAIGEYRKKYSLKRNAVIVLIDQNFRGDFRNATTRVAC